MAGVKLSLDTLSRAALVNCGAALQFPHHVIGEKYARASAVAKLRLEGRNLERCRTGARRRGVLAGAGGQGSPGRGELADSPHLFFMHYWANDEAAKLAHGLRAALDRMNVKKPG